MGDKSTTTELTKFPRDTEKDVDLWTYFSRRPKTSNPVKLEGLYTALPYIIKEEIDALSHRDKYSIDEQGRIVTKIPVHLHHVPLGPRVKTYMARPAARPAVEGTSVDDDNLKSNIRSDCGESMTITGPLADTKDVEEGNVIVDKAAERVDLSDYQPTG